MKSKNKELLEKINSPEFDTFLDEFFLERRKEIEESENYFKNGNFKIDLDKIRHYLNDNDFFCFEDNNYNNYITFLNERGLIYNIEKNREDNEISNEGIEEVEQEYNIVYEDLIFNFLFGLGTIITVTKIV